METQIRIHLHKWMRSDENFFLLLPVTITYTPPTAHTSREYYSKHEPRTHQTTDYCYSGSIWIFNPTSDWMWWNDTYFRFSFCKSPDRLTTTVAELTEDTSKFRDDYDMKHGAMFVYKHECENVNRNFIKRQVCPIYIQKESRRNRSKKGDQKKKN